MDKDLISQAVEDVYRWIGAQGIANTCSGCGDCCNFAAFDHLLFVTSVELIHFENIVGTENIKPMIHGICPYQVDNKCTVYESRFAGCRIFQCKGDDQRQGEVMEESLTRLKEIGERFGVDYRYVDLASGLDNLT